MTYGQCDEVDVNPLRYSAIMAAAACVVTIGFGALGLLWPPSGQLYILGIFPAGLALAGLVRWAIDSHRQDL